MQTFLIEDIEINKTIKVEAQGVAEAMFEYLPWPALDATIKFSIETGWQVIDNYTGHMYRVKLHAVERIEPWRKARKHKKD